ncbi:secretion protein HlyD family protein [Arcobacter nitrofigilis DSM 7299]|uniref:Secretion protein HlyD family protein n=1 Tax=Arcobacter nitrofigilis (strain ATCC 33309 / DSM 7299 / CCUG 15893 / LMG 7604 / NCTC 12251 / CI) TaxID=572480 RepID=D5V601_ARCNC|nr:HlyD family efflux transporter periplasmic adaptor subunit [Arcobacter nitrofigilis]ADG93168.1 secretion protein HlyD family protein [Arcobacter nitrofigilis DSM 7299]
MKNTNTKKPIEAPILIIIGSFFLLIIPFLVWASLTSIDQISHARGNVITTAKTQEIQSALDGIVKDIKVREGKEVKENDILIELEDSQYKAAYESSYSKVAALKATLARLKAEVYGQDLVFPEMVKKYPELIQTQKELFRRRQKAQNDEKSALTESLLLSKEELRLIKPLLKTGDVGSSEIIRIKRQIADKEGEIINKQNKYFQDSQAEMTKSEEELYSKEQELEDKKINLERTTIKATMDAIVKNIIITTRGAKVRPGDVILQLVPMQDKLIIETKLEPSEISFVKIGQKAAVKLDAYDYSIYGIFDGVVNYISPDTLVEKTNEGEKYYFRVQIAVDQKELISKHGKKIELTPGMTAQVDIVTGNRKVITYLTKPLIKTISQSFTER